MRHNGCFHPQLQYLLTSRCMRNRCETMLRRATRMLSSTREIVEHGISILSASVSTEAVAHLHKEMLMMMMMYFFGRRICSIGRTFAKPATVVAASKSTMLTCWSSCCYRCRCCCCCCCCRCCCSFCLHHWCHFCNTGDASDVAAAGWRCLIEVITLSISANRVGVQRIARQSR